MIQQILVLLIFAGALVYVIRLVVRQFTVKNECASGCGKCGIDFNKIEQQIAKKKI